MAPPVEITIPKASVASPPDSKPFTQYNITLHLPLRSYFVQKRYSDFLALHQTLTSLVGAPPPAPLPAKHWFQSTVSSPALTEERRVALETYLKSIAESPDRRWRDTPAWRTFLNLPAQHSAASGASSSGIASARGPPVIAPRDATAAAARDPRTWMDLHRETKALLNDARAQLARRDALASDGNTSAALDAGSEAKRKLVLAGNRLRALDEGLRDITESKGLGEGEIRRRRDLLGAARGDRDGLEKVSASVTGGGIMGAGREGTAMAGDKAALLARSNTEGGGSSGGGWGVTRTATGLGKSRRVLGAPLPETERTRELDNNGVLQLQRQQMAEQDQDVEQLAQIVRRQKEMGLAIQTEVALQNDMLDDFDHNVDRVGSKVNVAKNRVRKLGM